MFEQGLRFIRRIDLDQQLSTIFRHWDANPMQRAEFVGWAWVVAAASDFSAIESPTNAIDQIRSERDSIHQKLAEKLVNTSIVDLEMVSRRMFLDWLCSEIAIASRVAA